MDLPSVRVGPLSFSDRVGMARELLNALKEATRPGRRHLMHRALTIPSMWRHLTNQSVSGITVVGSKGGRCGALARNGAGRA